MRRGTGQAPTKAEFGNYSYSTEVLLLPAGVKRAARGRRAKREKREGAANLQADLPSGRPHTP